VLRLQPHLGIEKMLQERDKTEGIIALVKETADGFGQLLADHIKLARLELVADVKTQGARVAAVVLIIPFILLGYALACVGLALVLSKWMGLPEALFLVGGVHVIGGAAGLAVQLAKLKHANLMHETAAEVTQSVATLSSPAPVRNGAVVASRAVANPMMPSSAPSGGGGGLGRRTE
jgi:hypothetical protein